jgi:hypothetical protein
MLNIHANPILRCEGCCSLTGCPHGSPQQQQQTATPTM